MLLTADDPLRDDGIDQDEVDYINACLSTQTQPFNVQQVCVVALLCHITMLGEVAVLWRSRRTDS